MITIKMKLNLNLYLFNGPPRVGKDTLVNGLSKSNHGIKFSLAEPIRSTLYNIFPYINDSNIDDLKNKNLFINDTTETDITGRQFMIDYAENYIKPKFGKHIFIQLLIKKIINLDNKNNNIGIYDDTLNIYISDLGFKEEFDCIINNSIINNKYKVKFYLIRLHNENCSFDNDSRSYIKLEKSSNFIKVYDIENKKNGISNFIKEVQDIINKE